MQNVADYGLPPRETLILDEYREKRATYDKLLQDVKDVLADSIKSNNIYINAIEARIKAEDSLAGKLERKAGKYSSLSDLTDILGVRVITFYSDEVDKIAAMVGRLFEIDWENSIDKRKMHDIHSFGYSSLHYICRVPKALFEDPAYPELNSIRFEVQMRTALQHVWSVLDHDTGYKSGFEVPKEYLRNMNRLAGMLELADEQFCAIRTGINNYRRHVQSLVHSGKFDEVALDGDSFGNYLELRPFDSLNERIAAINQAEVHETSLAGYLKVLLFLGFKTLGDIEKMIKENSEDAYQLAAFQLANTDLDIINSSLALVNLCAVHILKRGGGVLELTRCLDELNGVSKVNRRRAEHLYERAKKLAFMETARG
jgi:ppGpp synthetase/RelA/SpoT-type nucleotidyltranferase